MKEFNDGKKLEEIISAIHEEGAVSAEEVREVIARLLEQNKISIEAADNEKESVASLKDLVNKSGEMVNSTEKQNESLESLSAATEAASMAGGDGGTSKIVDALKNLGGHLKTMVRQSAKSLTQNKSLTKIFNKVGKVLSKGKEKATKVTTAAKKGAAKAGGIALDAAKMAKGIGNSISGAITKVLNPIEMVKAFFEQLLPLLLIAGILIYAFITGWFDGDFMDVVGVLVSIIIAAVLAYIAWMMIKEAISQGIKILCEFLKVAIEATADWAAVYVIIAVIAVIALAFLLAAALIIIIIGLALVGIVIAVWMITKVITSMIEDMTEKIMGIMEEQFSALEDMIVSVISTFATLVPLLCSMMVTVAENLKKGIQKAINGISATFEMMTAVMQGLSDEISRIFNGLAAAILASALGQAVKKTEEEAAELTIETLNAELKMNGWLTATIASIVADGFLDIIEDLADACEDFLDDLTWAIYEPMQGVFSTIKDIMYDAIDGLLDFIDDATYTIMDIGFAVIEGIATIVAMFIAILFAMPLVGLLMGLVGTNSFSAALAPLISVAEDIHELLKTIVAANRANRAQTAVPSNTISSSSQTFVGGQYVNGDDYNTFAGLESRTLEETQETDSSSNESYSDDVSGITPDLFVYWMEKQYSAMKALASKDGGSGGFLNLFM